MQHTTDSRRQASSSGAALIPPVMSSEVPHGVSLQIISRLIKKGPPCPCLLFRQSHDLAPFATTHLLLHGEMRRLSRLMWAAPSRGEQAPRQDSRQRAQRLIRLLSKQGLELAVGHEHGLVVLHAERGSQTGHQG
jgi:hypothetical protein